MADKVRIAIIGFGRIGKRHAIHINKLAELAAICDTDSTVLTEANNLYPDVPVFNSIDDLINSNIIFDVLSVCTPNGLHSIHSIKGLKSGHHVICEKPMALNISDCGNMINTAEQMNKRLFAIKQNRFNPPVAAVKKAIEENKLGKIINVQLSCFWNRNDQYYNSPWKGKMDLDGGTLFTQFSHFIDLLYWLVGDVKSVSGFSKNSNHRKSIEFEDTGVVAVEFDNGAIGTINYTVNSYRKNMEGSITIFGELGTVKIGGQYLNELEYQEIDNFVIENLPTGNKANNYGDYQGSMSNHDKVYENLIDVLNNNKPISTSSFEGFKTVEIISKIYKEIRK